MGPPGIPIAILIIAAAAAVAALVMAAVRRIVRGPLLADPGRGTTMITVAGTAFAILLAFIIVDAFQTYSGAKSAADSESTQTLEMFRTAGLFPAEERETVRSDLVCYARAIAYSEWPAMEDGNTSPLVVPGSTAGTTPSAGLSRARPGSAWRSRSSPSRTMPAPTRASRDSARPRRRCPPRCGQL